MGQHFNNFLHHMQLYEEKKLDTYFFVLKKIKIEKLMAYIYLL